MTLHCRHYPGNMRGRDPDIEMYSVTLPVVHLNRLLSEIFPILLEILREKVFHVFFFLFLFFWGMKGTWSNKDLHQVKSSVPVYNLGKLLRKGLD